MTNIGYAKDQPSTQPSFADFQQVLEAKTQDRVGDWWKNSGVWIDHWSTKIGHFLMAYDPYPVAVLPADWDTTPGVEINTPQTIQHDTIGSSRPIGFQSRSLLEPTCSAVNQDRWIEISYNPCAVNAPSGHCNYGIIQITSTTNWTGSTYFTPEPDDVKPASYDVLFNYFEDFGSQIFNTALCNLHVDGSGSTVTCTKSVEDDRVNYGDFNTTQATNAILSSLRHYHDAATALYAQCEME